MFVSLSWAGLTATPYGMESRPAAGDFLNMPHSGDGTMPQLLSQTDAFKDVRNLVPSSNLIPYDINVAFWSDGASKLRWVNVPHDAKIGFEPTGEWKFPNGTVFVKQFEISTDETHPEIKRRLETRLLVRDANGGVYGVTYKWRADNSDAELLKTNLSEKILIKTATGVRTQTWYYPSRFDCLICHTTNAGMVLGVKTRQMNHEFTFPSGVADNEIRAWNHVGLFNSNLDEAGIAALPKLANYDDTSRSLEDRARSYLDANCAHCHRPAGVVANFDTRYDTPLSKQGLIEGSVLFNQGIDHGTTIAPNDIWRSLIYLRVDTLGGLKMPPLAHQELDEKNIALLRQWVESLGGPPVLEPPTVSPHGGNFAQPVTVTITHREPGVALYYTLDGSMPTKSDTLYSNPIKITSPVTLRVRAYKQGFTHSTEAQETFIVGD
jgi:uncharacterized repeat protein (TIGR03806 family)